MQTKNRFIIVLFFIFFNYSFAQTIDKYTVCQSDTFGYSPPSNYGYNGVTGGVVDVGGGWGLLNEVGIIWGSPGSGQITWDRYTWFGTVHEWTYTNVTILNCVRKGCTDASIILTSSLYSDAVYKSNDGITAQDAFTISSGDNVNFYAGNSIELLPGFIANDGSSFIAGIQNCTVGSYKMGNNSKQINQPIDSNSERPEMVNVFPNPNNGTFILQIKNETKRNPNSFNIVINDILGNTIYLCEMTRDKLTIDLSAQSQGIYFVKVISSQGEVLGVEKVVVEK